MPSLKSHPLLSPWDGLVQAAPEALAIQEAESNRRWTRLDLDRRAGELAEEITDVGRSGEPVIFQGGNGGEWLARFLCLLRLNRPALPIDPTTPPAGLSEIAARMGASVWRREGEWDQAARPRRFRASIALIKLTSGTTSAPNALPFRAEELAADGRQVMAGMGIGAKDRNFALIPFGHSYGLGNLIMPLLLQGTPIVCGSSPLPHIVATDFASGEATILPAVPALFGGLVQAEVALPGLRLAISAGAPLPPDLAAAFRRCFGKPIHNFLGSSESGGIAFDADGEAGETGRAVGKPLPGVNVTFDRSGRLLVSSPAIFTCGNRRRKGEVAAVLLGDRGEMNDRGELVLRGRSRPMIKVGARRLDPAELEYVLLGLDGVREAWVSEWSNGGEARPAAVVATECSPSELRENLRRTLPGWKIPRPLVCVPAFPLTARGKPDRAALLALISQAGAPVAKG
jgi:long-chain acyl-CoA synthetase